MLKTLILIIEYLFIILPVLIGVAYMTLVEREILASIQRRKGPNVVGVAGFLQPLADGLKLMIKEVILPTNVNTFLFILAPVITFVGTMMYWAVLPLSKGVAYTDLNIGVLFFYAISSLAIYGIIISGWASNTKYPFMGSIRSTAQMVSYELSIGVVFAVIFLCTGSLNFTKIVLAQKYIWFVIPLFPLFVICFIALLAECNRHPFDLPEAEGELVSGFNTEYSAMGFALFFIGEYGNIIVMSVLISILFFGGWLPLFNLTFIPGVIWLVLKVCVFSALYVIVRGAYVRFRYDQLMRIGWKSLLPLCFGWFILLAGILVAFNTLPNTLCF